MHVSQQHMPLKWIGVRSHPMTNAARGPRWHPYPTSRGQGRPSLLPPAYLTTATPGPASAGASTSPTTAIATVAAAKAAAAARALT